MNEELDALLRQLADADVRHDAPPHVETAVMRAWRAYWPVASGWWLVAHRQPAGRMRRFAWVGVPLTAAALLFVALVLWRDAGVSTYSNIAMQPAASESFPAPPIETQVHELPATSHQPPAIASQLPATSHQPPAGSHQATGHRPSAASVRASADKPTPSDPATEQPSYLLVGAPSADAPLSVVRLRMSRSSLATLGLPLPNPDAAALVDVDVFVGEDGVARAIRPVALVSSVSQE